VQWAGKTGDLATQAQVSVKYGRCAGVHSGEAMVNRTTPEKEWMYQTSGQQETLLGHDMLLGGLWSEVLVEDAQSRSHVAIMKPHQW